MQPAIHLRCFRQPLADGVPVDEVLAQCAAWGAARVVVPWGLPGNPAPGLTGQGPAQLDRVVRQAQRHGLRVAAFYLCTDFAHPDAGWRQQQITAAQELLRISSDLGVPDLMLWTGRCNAEDRPAEAEALVDDAFAACTPVAEATGVRLAVENHVDVYPDVESLIALCQAHGKWVRLCPNPALWGIQADREGFFSGDDAVHAGIRAALTLAGPCASMVHLGIWPGEGVHPDPWGRHWPALIERMRATLPATAACCLQTFGPGDPRSPVADAIAALKAEFGATTPRP